MGNFLRISNGIGRSFAESGSTPIYDQRVTVVASGAGVNQVNGPVTAGTPVTLPSSGTYTVVSGVTSLNIYLNNTRTEYVIDWSTSGAGPSFTAVTFTFDLVVGDYIDIRAERNT